MLIATDRFDDACRAMARIGGIEGVRWAVVAHPLGSVPDDVLAERAREAVDQFEEIVVAGG